MERIWPGYHGAQLSIAQSSYEAQQTRQKPDEAGETDWARVLEDSLGTDEDTGAHDDPDDDAGAVHQSQLPFEFRFLSFSLRFTGEHWNAFRSRGVWVGHCDCQIFPGDVGWFAKYCQILSANIMKDCGNNLNLRTIPGWLDA